VLSTGVSGSYKTAITNHNVNLACNKILNNPTHAIDATKALVQCSRMAMAYPKYASQPMEQTSAIETSTRFIQTCLGKSSTKGPSRSSKAIKLRKGALSALQTTWIIFGSCLRARKSVTIARMMIAAGHHVPNGTLWSCPLNHGSCGAVSTVHAEQ
jgi:hypothetical protein